MWHAAAPKMCGACETQLCTLADCICPGSLVQLQHFVPELILSAAISAVSVTVFCAYYVSDIRWSAPQCRRISFDASRKYSCTTSTVLRMPNLPLYESVLVLAHLTRDAAYV